MKIACFTLALLIAGAASAQAGPFFGSACRVDGVLAYDTNSYYVFFVEGEDATVLVGGDIDTRLDLYVYDDRSDKPVASDTDRTNQCVVNFRAPRRGMYRIEVVNLGPVITVYTICVE